MASLLPYLQRLEITGVEESDTPTTLNNYLPIKEIVEAVDQEGNPWEPVPGPDPWDDLVWVNKSSTAGSTVLGSVLTGTPGTVTGGAPPVVVVSQWQRSATTSGFAGFTEWTELGSTPVTYTTTVDDNGMYVRLATKATDAEGTVFYGSGNSVGPMTPAAISIGNGTKISNGSFVNPPEVYSFQQVTPIPATFSGGFGTLVIETRLQKYSGATASWINIDEYTTTPAAVDVNGLDTGTKIRAQTRATDATGQTKTSTSAATPRVGTTTTIGTVTITPEPLAIATGISQMFKSEITGGTASDFNYQWSVRSGSAQLMSSNNISDEALYRFDNTGTTQIQVYVSDPSASNSPQSFVATIVVS